MTQNPETVPRDIKEAADISNTSANNGKTMYVKIYITLYLALVRATFILGGLEMKSSVWLVFDRTVEIITMSSSPP